jgi:spermidine synthase
MSWEHLDSGKVNDIPLDLYRSGSDYMIRVDGLELMNSRWPRSERELARIAARVAARPDPRVLIGGLGLGFTLAAALDEFGEAAEIYVSERSPDVLRWYKSYFRPLVLDAREDSKVRFDNRDVHDLIHSGPPFDLILLDVDNGPSPISGSSNARLYSETGMGAIRSRLRPGGSLLVWSAFESETFLRSAQAAGFHIDCVPIPVGLREHEHFVYCARTSENEPKGVGNP